MQRSFIRSSAKPSNFAELEGLISLPSHVTEKVLTFLSWFFEPNRTYQSYQQHICCNISYQVQWCSNIGWLCETVFYILMHESTPYFFIFPFFEIFRGAFAPLAPHMAPPLVVQMYMLFFHMWKEINVMLHDLYHVLPKEI